MSFEEWQQLLAQSQGPVLDTSAETMAAARVQAARDRHRS